MRYRAELVDGTVIAETSQEGVEFYVKDGDFDFFITVHSWKINDFFITMFILCGYVLSLCTDMVGCLGHLCPALAKAIRTMEMGEKARLIVQPQCMSLFSFWNFCCCCCCS